MNYIAERDAKGRITRPAEGVLEILAAGRKFNWASPHRRMCERCRSIAMRGSPCCWRHDPEHRRNRAKIALASGDPARIAKAFIRKHRVTMEAVWRRDPWFNGMTLWLVPGLEAAFGAACRDAALPVETRSSYPSDCAMLLKV